MGDSQRDPPGFPGASVDPVNCEARLPTAVFGLDLVFDVSKYLVDRFSR